MRRRDALCGPVAAALAALAGCTGAPAVDAPGESAVGDPFPLRTSDRRTVAVRATDARREPFRTDVRVGPAGATPTTPADAAATRRPDGSSDAVRSRGMAGDALRTPLAHLRPARDPSPASFVAWTGSDAGEVRVDVGDGAAGRTVSRTVVDPDVETRPPAHPDVSGLSVRPPGDGPHPGVLLLHGSSGALPGKYARALATHGYAVLAPQYFGAPGLPASLDGVPLSSVDRALSGLAGRPDVRDGRVGVVGLSRGVEAALLTAAARDGPTAVVGYAGSGLVATGLDADGRPTGRAAWTRDGDPVVPADALRRSRRAVSTASAACDSLGCAVDRLRDDDRVPPAAVPVERVEGPVALFSGARDALWDAGLRSAYAARRLAARDHGHDFCHVSYGRAGHVFHVPYADYSTLAGPRLGGSPAANATAAADSWVRALDYLGVPAGAGE